MTRLYVGVDGGATRARAVVTDVAGSVLARREAGGAIVRPEDPAAAAATVAALTRVALDDVHPGATAVALCCALAGAGRAEEQRVVTELLMRTGIAERITVVSDAHAALQDAFGAGPGILLIAGTGSVAWARGEDGRLARAGGWGHLLGDEGSGYATGLAALRSVARADDGREPVARLHGRILQHTGSAVPADLVSWTARATKAEIAALSVLVAQEADAGDACAASIVRCAVDALLELTRAVHARLRPWRDPAPVALTGGLAEAVGPLRRQLVAALSAEPQRYVLRADPVDAARGAAALARRAQDDAALRHG